MTVQARFYVNAITKRPMGAPGYARPAPLVEVDLIPATRGEENKQWASATPSGQIKMTIGNPEAAAWFEAMLGEDIAITFEARSIVEADPRAGIALDEHGAPSKDLRPATTVEIDAAGDNAPHGIVTPAST